MAILSVRLDGDLEKRLAAQAKRLGSRRSDLVRRILDAHLPLETEQLSPRDRLERLKHVLGSIDSGVVNLGTDHEQHLKAGFDAERDRTMGHRPAGGTA